MKKYFLSFCLLMVTVPAWCQFVINPQVGVNFSNPPTVSQQGVSAKGKAGLMAGLNFRIGGNVFVSPGVYWTLLNGHLTQEGITDVESDLQLNSVNVPLLLGFNVVNQPGFNFRLVGGPAAYLVYNIHENNLGLSRADIKNIYAIRLGAGLDIVNYTLDFSYDLGLNTPYKNIAEEIRYSPLNVMLGIKLGFD
jgi:hypothetical protein